MNDECIRTARWPDDLSVVRELLLEYEQGLGVDLCFQGFEAELRGLPGAYAPPRGTLMLAWRGAEAVGCIAMRPLDERSAEMKRLYVRPAARGTHLGRSLAISLCDAARAAGYARICLDTLPRMTQAQGLYASLGFLAAPPHVFNPVAGTKYLALDL